MLDSWNGFRAKQNLNATQGLFDRLLDIPVPVLMMPRSSIVRLPPEMGQFVTPWIPGESLPKFDPSEHSARFKDSISLYGLDEEPSAVVIRNLRYRLISPETVTVELTEIKADQLPKFLDRWFQKVPVQK